MAYEFMGEVECFDYLDAMFNDGHTCGTMIEDHTDTRGTPMDGLAEGFRDRFAPADEIAQSFERTWGAIEMLPQCDGGTWYL